MYKDERWTPLGRCKPRVHEKQNPTIFPHHVAHINSLLVVILFYVPSNFLRLGCEAYILESLPLSARFSVHPIFNLAFDVYERWFQFFYSFELGTHLFDHLTSFSDHLEYSVPPPLSFLQAGWMSSKICASRWSLLQQNPQAHTLLAGWNVTLLLEDHVLPIEKKER